MANDLSRTAQRALKTMFDDLDGINVDDIQTNGITIRSGNKIIKLEVALEEPLTIEDEVREEFRQKLAAKLQEIKNRLNSKVTEMVEVTSRVRIEAERKEADLKEKLKLSKPMPDVNWRDAKSGISVVKGERRDEMIWLIRGVYAPKFVDQKPITPAYAKKLITNIVFLIRTVQNKITEVSTRKPLGLGFFSHYHQNRPDCWGNWKYPKTWKTVEDLIKIGREAEAVLENINTGSIANSTPRGLPRRRTLEKHVSKKDRVTDAKLNSDQTREGIGEVSSTGDVWGS
jgi:hypothetical protein